MNDALNTLVEKGILQSYSFSYDGDESVELCSPCGTSLTIKSAASGFDSTWLCFGTDP